jgi:hypothetical protein
MAEHEDHASQESGTLVVLDGLPVVSHDQRPTLTKFLLRKLGDAAPTDSRKVYMPVDAQGSTVG